MNKIPNGYQKRDYDFSTTRGILGFFYTVSEVVLGGGMIITALHLFSHFNIPELMVVLGLILVMLSIYVTYSFYIGFLELIKHSREIRDELVSMKSQMSKTREDPTVSPLPKSEMPTSPAGMRYDPITHDYVKV